MKVYNKKKREEGYFNDYYKAHYSPQECEICGKKVKFLAIHKKSKYCQKIQSLIKKD
jgi:formamidopyrimidine-DNA glycosylase